MRLPDCEVHKRLYENRNKYNASTPQKIMKKDIYNTSENVYALGYGKPLLAITGENKTLAELKKLREQKQLEK